jgi:hypothetical protein
MPQRWKELGYSSKAAYVNFLVVYDMLTRRPHRLTAAMDKMSREEQDKIFENVAELFDSGKSINGVWLEARLKEIAEQKGADPEEMVHKLLKLLTSPEGAKEIKHAA